LGHIVTENGIKADIKKINAVVNMPQPTNVKPLEERRRSALRYIRHERNTAALFLRPTDMTRTQFLEHDLVCCSCIWCFNWFKRQEFQDKLLGNKRDIELAKNRYETEWTQIHEAQSRALDCLHFNRHLQEQQKL
jgi:hypothetical protein